MIKALPYNIKQLNHKLANHNSMTATEYVYTVGSSTTLKFTNKPQNNFTKRMCTPEVKQYS